MKVVFFNVDGVLNTPSTKIKVAGCPFVDDEKLYLLKTIVKRTDAKLVLSSIWRTGWRKDAPSKSRQLTSAFIRKLDKFGLSIYDITGNCDTSRGKEIETWLKKHPEVSRYIILDYRGDMGKIKKRLIRTSALEGLCLEHVKRAVKMLHISPWQKVIALFPKNFWKAICITQPERHRTKSLKMCDR